MSLRSLIAALLLLAGLIFLSLHIIELLRQSDRLQDCVMQGRTNCAAAAQPANH